MDNMLAIAKDLIAVAGEWWKTHENELFSSLDTHKMLWVYGISIVGLASVFILGGSLLKNGVIYGLLITVALLLLVMHCDDKEKMKKRLLWLAKHGSKVDLCIWVACSLLFISSGMTTGVAMTVVSLATTILFHKNRDWHKAKGLI